MVSSVNSNSSISQLFAKLDTKSQGYLEKSDLLSAFAKIGGDSSSSSADEVFQALDSDSDGKVTESEFSTTLSKLQEKLDSQFTQMRMQGHGGHGPQGMGGMPPPPPQDDAGFTKDELSSQLEDIGSSDSQRSSFISNVVQNFEAADTDGDGKVSFSEAQAYNSKSSTSTGTDTTGTASTTASSTTAAANSDSQVMFKIMQLMHAYGSFNDNSSNSALSSLLSVSV
ncbi:EF-hand domain-containing protein [Dechloromonas sp. XY25]|uniref:EF-hand domain-containing protein n=1 Tax=Dechloromonas hankyongensis TaxID=2908002 RepID=A0ABS9K6I7_9RHOO|nr:EF-hand domain-containing protein [Dechloromonas hankyongensis]MCG2578790.1 EF-hand domain-containing protein [Dechloromonas hankyongensis]